MPPSISPKLHAEIPVCVRMRRQDGAPAADASYPPLVRCLVIVKTRDEFPPLHQETPYPSSPRSLPISANASTTVRLLPSGRCPSCGQPVHSPSDVIGPTSCSRFNLA